MNRWFRPDSSDVQHVVTSRQNKGKWEMVDVCVRIGDLPHLYILVCECGFALRQASDADIFPRSFINELRAASSA